jgi:hypothetical protein
MTLAPSSRSGSSSRCRSNPASAPVCRIESSIVTTSTSPHVDSRGRSEGWDGVDRELRD